MTEDTARSVRIERTSLEQYVVHNVRGGSLSLGTGQNDDFTPVELLLAAIGGCTSADIDLITSRRAEPTGFVVEVSGNKIRDEAGGNRMQDLTLVVTATFPDGPDGDRARQMLPRAQKMSHDRLCTVSRTVELGSPVSVDLAP